MKSIHSNQVRFNITLTFSSLSTAENTDINEGRELALSFQENNVLGEDMVESDEGESDRPVVDY